MVGVTCCDVFSPVSCLGQRTRTQGSDGCESATAPTTGKTLLLTTPCRLYILQQKQLTSEYSRHPVNRIAVGRKSFYARAKTLFCWTHPLRLCFLRDFLSCVTSSQDLVQNSPKLRRKTSYHTKSSKRHIRKQKQLENSHFYHVFIMICSVMPPQWQFSVRNNFFY